MEAHQGEKPRGDAPSPSVSRLRLVLGALLVAALVVVTALSVSDGGACGGGKHGCGDCGIGSGELGVRSDYQASDLAVTLNPALPTSTEVTDLELIVSWREGRLDKSATISLATRVTLSGWEPGQKVTIEDLKHADHGLPESDLYWSGATAVVRTVYKVDKDECTEQDPVNVELPKSK